MTPRRFWTPDEVDALRRLYPHHSAAEVGKALNRAPGSVHQKATSLGIRKSAEFLASQRSGRILRGQKNEAMRVTQFKPGQRPWNKGTNYNPGGRCAETQFKPGQRPHTSQPVGAYRIITDRQKQKHLEQKTSDRAGPNYLRWTPVARLVWEAAHGPIKKGWLVVFKRGMKTTVLEEITLDRLDCITRAEHARRNHPNNHSPEMARLYQLKGAINRQVNRLNKQAQQEAQQENQA